jgi:apolipoprotein D and lipocalin family protein
MKPPKPLISLALASTAVFVLAQTEPRPGNTSALQALPSLNVASYMGTWYQVLWFPNRFQKQCVADTTATYRDLGNGTIEVINRCRVSDGQADSVTGVARPPSGVSRIEAGALVPARLEVSFLPAWLRWTGVGWGAYWAIDLAPDGRYVIISEASREYLWVLSRKPALTSDDDAAIRTQLRALGFDPSKLQRHPQRRG